jgi:hypothetical protein
MPQRALLRKLLFAVATVILAPQAEALTTLDAKLVDVSCSLVKPGGIQSFSCRTFYYSPGFTETVGFTAAVTPGQTAMVQGFIEYTYSDDGLPLDRPRWFQMDANGFRTLGIDHEGGALYAMSNNCFGSRYCRPQPGTEPGGNTGFPPLLLGLNDVPDRLTGRVPVSGTLAVASGYPVGAQQDVYVQWLAFSYSGVAPIPEPSTWMLLPVGLLALNIRRRGGLKPSLQRCERRYLG